VSPGGADSTSVSPIGVSKNLARALNGLQEKPKTLRAKWQVLKNWAFERPVSCSPAVPNSTGIVYAAGTGEQMAKKHQN